jgi:hypothetical protein
LGRSVDTVAEGAFVVEQGGYFSPRRGIISGAVVEIGGGVEMKSWHAIDTVATGIASVVTFTGALFIAMTGKQVTGRNHQETEDKAQDKQALEGRVSMLDHCLHAMLKLPEIAIGFANRR